MANMPPQRSNYQQRVGRAGRARQPFSFAVTLCRDRSHDDYYFVHAERITGDDPAQPYLDLSRPEIVRRVVVAECLRRAYLSLPEAMTADISGGVHGQFGSIELWPRVRSAVDAWLTASDEVEEVTTGLCAYTPMEPEEVEAIRNYVRQGLIPAIDKAVGDQHLTQPDLSERLANAAILPMFGFPSRVRSLYQRPPATLDDEEAAVSGRPLGMAISSFAPGAEIVKDKQLHTCVGFAHYEPKFGRMAPADPLGPPIAVDRCPNCEAISPGKTEPAPASEARACTECGGPLSQLDLYEPHGFRTDFQPADFSEPDSRGSTTSAPGLAVVRDDQPARQVGPVAVHSYSGREVFEINDNGGRLYDLYRHRGTVLAPGHGRAGEAGPFGDLLDNPPDVQGAIASIRPTDVMVLELAQLDLPGGPRPLLLDGCPAARSAFWSFGELLRLAASDVLEIDARRARAWIAAVALGARPQPTYLPCGQPRQRRRVRDAAGNR